MPQPDFAQRDEKAGEPNHSANSPIRLLIVGLVVGAAYYVGALIGFTLTFPQSAVSVLWPPNAILFTALLLTPARKWWAIMLSVFPIHVIVQLQSGVPILMNLFWFLSNSGEALIGAICVRRFIERRADFAGSKNLAIYVGVAIFAPFLGSFIDASFVSLVGWKENTYWQTWFARFPSNVLAALAIPPLIILWLDHGAIMLRNITLWRGAEASILGFGLLTIGLWVFCWETGGSQAMTVLIYLPLPFLLWAATRFGQLGASTAFLLIVMTSICGAFLGGGPFISQFPAENVLSLQLFLIAIFLPVMFLAALAEEQNYKTKVVRETKPLDAAFDGKRLSPQFGFGVAAIALWAACYFGSVIGLALLFPSSYFSVIWPANAILLAALMLYPPRSWSLFLLVGSIAHVVAQGRFDTPAFELGLYYVYDCALVLVTALAVRQSGASKFDLGNLRRTTIFVAQIAAATGLMAWVWPLILITLGRGSDNIWLEWRHAFLSNLLPFLVLTPGIVLGSARAPEVIKRASLKHWMEAIVLLAGLLGSGIGVFGLKSQALGNFPALLFIPVPFLLWAAVRLGPAGLSLSFVVFAFMAILNALAGHGPFVGQLPDENVFWLEIFLIVLYLPLLLLASLFEERREKVQALGETENRFRIIADSAPIMIWVSGTDKLCTFFSKGWLDFTGQTLEEELGNGWAKGVHPGDLDRCLRTYLESFDKQHGFTIEYRLRRADGEYRWILNKGVPRFGPGGVFLGYTGSAVDITERMETEQALRESEERYRTLAETATDVIMTLDQNSTILFANPAVVNVFGYAPGELIGQKITMLMPESLHQRHQEGLRRYLQSGGKSLSWNSVSFPGLHKSGREIMLDISFTESEIGYTRLFTGIMRDVTERKRAESRQNTQYAITRILSGSDSIAAAAPQLIQSICECLDWEFGEIWQVDHETNLLTCCETWHPPSKDLARFAAASRQFTFSPGVGLPGRVWTSGRPAWIYDLAADRNFLRTSLTMEAGLHSAFAFPIVLGDETLGIMVFFSHENREPDEDLLQMMASVGSQMGQFAERKRAEDALRESEARLQLGMEAARFGCWEVEVTTGKTTRSPSLERLLGVPPGSMGTIREAFIPFIHPEDREIPLRHLERCIETFKSTDIEYRIIRPDGTIRWMASRGQAILGADGRVSRVVGMSADITERKRAEEELKKALAEVQRLKERLELENVYLRSEVLGAHRYGEIIGESEGIRKVLEEVGQVAATDMTVLILGETGTGKELVARLVYEKSGRRERPLVKVNCSALPAELIESELFGHERGAFTGAVAKQVGRFELADGGTIFLDEVGELPLRLQSKLLTVLQEGEFERLGSGKTIKVDVRVIAATNRNLSEAVQRGRFRSDLYYRLNVYPIEIPPLREHREDIGLLAEAFLQEAGRRLGKSFGKIPGEVIKALQDYTWPGNVRELENVIGRAAVTSTGLTLQLPDGWNQASDTELCFNPSTMVSEPFMFHKENTQSPLTLEQFERTRILEILHQTNWRIEGPRGAALILGLHPNTLRSRMNKLGIRRSAKPRNLVAETTK